MAYLITDDTETHDWRRVKRDIPASSPCNLVLSRVQPHVWVHLFLSITFLLIRSHDIRHPATALMHRLLLYVLDSPRFSLEYRNDGNEFVLAIAP